MFVITTRLTLASALGPFGVYLLTFTLPGALIHYLASLELNLPLDQKLHLLSQAHENFQIHLM